MILEFWKLIPTNPTSFDYNCVFCLMIAKYIIGPLPVLALSDKEVVLSVIFKLNFVKQVGCVEVLHCCRLAEMWQCVGVCISIYLAAEAFLIGLLATHTTAFGPFYSKQCKKWGEIQNLSASYEMMILYLFTFVEGWHSIEKHNTLLKTDGIKSKLN